MTNRKLKDYLPIVFKGMGMGAADIVPGVSGGTIAFITGIYEELVNSLKGIPQAFPVLFKAGIPAFWKAANINFLLALFGGIGISLVSLVRVIHYLLDTYPVLLWAFFFGLILASALVIGKKINDWKLTAIMALLIGLGIAFWINISSPASTPETTWFIFFSGMIAICAMILPGISGSFILLLLRKYEFIIQALKDFDIAVIATFGMGCAIGLITFANVLSWMFKRFYTATISLLTGFMIGSLNVVWPWKNVIESRVNSKGEEVPFLFESVLPNNFEGDAMMWGALICAVFGFLLIIIVEKYSKEAPPTAIVQ